MPLLPLSTFFIPFAAIAVVFLAIFLEQPRSKFLHLFPTTALYPQQASAFDAEHNVTYVGTVSRSHVEHFQGIFYAEDTSGKNRCRAPIPYQPARGSIINATQPGAWCPQGTGEILPFSSYIDDISEHCLSLRVSRPAGYGPDARLPVMVWIFSGGHALGSAYEKLYNPDGLVAQSVSDGQPVVYVAMNYRLGFFGFAMNRALLEQKNTNLGIRDQRAAFDWVKHNIHHFGGDSDRITAFGHSVGGLDIGLHLISYGGNKGVPFQKAVMLSGATGLGFNMQTDFAKQNTLSVARQLGCAGADDEGQSQEAIECLQKVPMDRLVNVSVSEARAARPVFGELYRSVAIDGDMFVDRPSKLIRAGKVAKGVPLILSWDVNDGAWYPTPTLRTDTEVIDSFKLWLFNLSKSTTDKLLTLYPESDFTNMVRSGLDGPVTAQYYRAAQISRDLWFTCPALDFAWQYARNGGAGTAGVHMHEGNATRYGPVFNTMGVPFWRVSHLSSIPYVFNAQQVDAGADNSAEQLAIARLVSSSIVSFATHDSPAKSRSSVKHWPPAFAAADEEQLKRDHATGLTLQVFGGRQGSRVVSTWDDTAEKNSLAHEEKKTLLERCAFLNNDNVRAEIGS